MKTRKLSHLLAMPLALALAALACGSPSTPEAQPTSPPRPTVTPPAATQPPETGGAIRSYQDVDQATIQIVVEGSFATDAFGTETQGSSAGTGFIIDPSGLAVTNNHVVTGAARLKAYLQGEEYDVRVLGVSECADLAVVQLDGENFPYLELYTGSVEPGLEVYAAGFPLGDPEFTLTKGIVSKARADGETSWASVDSVIEHDATINPGNSGGPLVNTDGLLVGINYAGSSSTNQYYAIKAQDAERLIDQLADGNDVDSIGINGEAVLSEDGTLYGIWVRSVKSGSPADNVGIQPGDILTQMEGIALAAQGTMTEYCDILRSHNPDDTLSIEVLRFGTQEYLAGQLNGRALETSYSFASQLGGETSGSTSSGSTTSYSGYVTVQDDSGAIQMSVPQEWSEVNGSSWTDDGEVIGVAISASANLQGYQETWTEPGVFFGVSNQLSRLGGYIQLLDIRKNSLSQTCTYEGRTDYADSNFEGKYDVFSDCADTGNLYVVLSARPIVDQTAYLILVEVQIMTDADIEALDQIYQTFNVVGALP